MPARLPVHRFVALKDLRETADRFGVGYTAARPERIRLYRVTHPVWDWVWLTRFCFSTDCPNFERKWNNLNKVNQTNSQTGCDTL